MQSFGALALAVALAAAGPVGTHDAVAAADEAEAYVAELDADWNVAREVRVACDVDQGCAIDLPFSTAGAGRLSVHFDAVHGGKVEIKSSVEDGTGRAVQQPDVLLALDHDGFAATHVGPVAVKSTGAGRVILMAVKVPGYLAPTAASLPARGQPI